MELAHSCLQWWVLMSFDSASFVLAEAFLCIHSVTIAQSGTSIMDAESKHSN